MEVVVPSAECHQVGGFIRAAIFHPDHVVQLKREHVRAARIGALISSFG
jgi:hypothetical protein